MIQSIAPGACKFDGGIHNRTVRLPPGRGRILVGAVENSAINS